jgi:hypothetical protein
MKSHLAILVAMVMLVAFSGLAQAAVLTFDDLSATSLSLYEAPIPSGYGGFNWSGNFYYLNATDAGYTNSGYVAGTISSPNVAFNDGAQDVTISSATSFTFNGAYFTSAWDKTLNIGIKGYSNAGLTLLYNTTVAANNTSPVYASLNWSGITELTFTSNGGDQFAIDNFTYNASAVPLPRALLLFGSGLAGLAIIRKRFKK